MEKGADGSIHGSIAGTVTITPQAGYPTSSNPNDCSLNLNATRFTVFPPPPGTPNMYAAATTPTVDPTGAVTGLAHIMLFLQGVNLPTTNNNAPNQPPLLTSAAFTLTVYLYN
jgi:hypothetical protein